MAPKKGFIPWNKGLTKETSEILKKQGEDISKSMIGSIPWNKGKKGLQIAWNKGIPMSEESKQKDREKHLNKKDSQETKDKKSKSHTGKHWNWKEESKIKASESRIECLKNNPEIIRRGKDHYAFGRFGKLSNRYGKPPSHGRKSYYHVSSIQGEIMMHHWDELYATYLESIGEPYLYEPEAFPMLINNKQTTYRPDFFLLNKNKFIEIKGYWRDDAKQKSDKFIELYSKDYNYEILMKKDLKNLGIKL